MTKGKKNNFHRQSLNAQGDPEQDKMQPADVRQLSIRLFKYADKIKENKEKKRQQIDNQRGNAFTPILETEKYNSRLEVVNEKRDVYADLFEDSQRRENTKQVIRKTLNSKKGSIASNNDLYLSVSKPSIGSKYKKFGSSQKLEHVRFNNESKGNPKNFSSSIYTAHKKTKNEP